VSQTLNAQKKLFRADFDRMSTLKWTLQYLLFDILVAFLEVRKLTMSLYPLKKQMRSNKVLHKPGHESAIGHGVVGSVPETLIQ
jgi:hypothetical protein